MMTSSILPAEEEDALRRILRHHGVPLTRPLLSHLASLINWVRRQECDRSSFSPIDPGQPPFMLVFLSSLGIYGAEVISSVPLPIIPQEDVV